MARRVFWVVLILSWLAANLLLGGEWKFYALGDLGGDQGAGRTSQALGVSSDGDFVVGDSLATAGLGITTGTEALLCDRPGRPRGIGTLPMRVAPGAEPFSSAWAVSRQGSVVVGESDTNDGRRAFRWNKQQGIVSLGTLPGHNYSIARDVSGDGQIVVGESSSPVERLAFRWIAGKLTSIGDLPGGKRESSAWAISLDGQIIAGHSSSANGTEAFRWSAGGMQGLGSLGGKPFTSYAFAVSADGEVIVGESISPRGTEAFRWTKKTGMEPLGDLPRDQFLSKAMAVSAGGNTIVGTATSEQGSEAFIWTEASGLQSLERLLHQKGLATGWRLQKATGISGDGTVIVGVGVNPAERTEGWIAKWQP